MRIRKRESLPKTSPYFKRDLKTGEVLEIRAPAACVMWPQKFRMKLISDWQSPSINFRQSEAHRYQQFMSVPPYTLHGQSVQFVIVHRRINPRNDWTNCLTLIQTNRKPERLLLLDPDPAMRTLMVYMFLTDLEVYGFPPLRLVGPDFA